VCSCGRNEAKIKALKDAKKNLMEQKQRHDEKLTTFKHQMVRLQNLCVPSANFSRYVSLQLRKDVAF
jgi:hypothetical protein